ncbi:MAG: hypothetical protein KDJ88_01895, partial [Bauldia sp.]|nr:hypothetical protein [Bauldia sp.]
MRRALPLVIVLLGAGAAFAQEPIVLTPPGAGGPPVVEAPVPAAPAAPVISGGPPSASRVPLPPPRPDNGGDSEMASTAELPALPTVEDIPDLPTGTFSDAEPLPDPANLATTEPAPLAQPLAQPVAQPVAERAPETDAELATIAPPPPAPGGPDLAYGAFQRGLYLTAFDIAIQRAEAGDVAAQTLIGLIYEGGYGVPQSFTDALGWYQLAAQAGDREAQFALGMM